MRKKFLIFSIVCLLFCTLSYTYSSFKNTIVGNISGNIKDWVFKVSIDNSTKYEDGYKLHLTGTSGSFNVNINTVGGSKNADYSIELIGDSSIKYYTDSSYTNLISNNIYNGSINSNTSGTITIYYKSSSNINSDILIKTKGSIMEIAMMKNGYSRSNGGTEFWSDTYRPYIRTINFGNDLSNLPGSCTEENLCWDISYDKSQKKKVYGYLTDSGLKDSTDNTKVLYNLYIVSDGKIFAPFGSGTMFNNFKNLTQINFNNNFDTSKATDMNSMFKDCSSLTSLNLSDFNTTNVTYMNQMFSGCSSLTNLDLNSFDTSNVTSMYDIFLGCKALTSLDLSSFNTSNVTSMAHIFWYCSSLTNLDLSSFNTSNVTDMYSMFYGCSSLTSLNLSSFNTSSVTDMSKMFTYCSSLTSLDLSGFNTANVTNMNGMFSDCKSLTNLDLSGFNTSSVTDMSKMFAYCSSLTSLDLSSFNTSNVTNIKGIFCDCSSLTSLDLSKFDTSKITEYGESNDNMAYGVFYGCSKLTTTINIMNANITGYTAMFYNAATDPNAKITVNYIADASTIVDSMITTRSSTSNVVKGSIIPEYSITISGNDDITYECINRLEGAKVTLKSISGNNLVTSFKMNGTTISGNEFTMPGSNVTITDIVVVEETIVETDHNPYLNSQSNVVLIEKTFEGAKSLTVMLDYQTESTSYDYFYIYDSSTATSGINNNKKYGGKTRTTETITINSNYIKITFKSDSSGNNYYGLKATIIPNY